MFLENAPIDYTSLIITVVCFVLVIAILIFAVALMIKRRGDNNLEKPIVMNTKIFKNTLNDFFDAVGGTNNVNKIEYNDEKKCLVVFLEKPYEANKWDILSNYNLYKREFFDDRIELYFVDSKAFYDSLFGK